MNPGQALDALSFLARPGDLVFRGTHSLEGRVVRWYDGASEYTHVGVLVENADATRGVVHASPDKRCVTLEPLESFLHTEGIHAAALYRWTGIDALERDRLQQDAKACLGRRFDGAFDAADLNDLYCTELVWQLARQQGWVGNPPLRSIRTPLGVRHVITVEALMRDLPLAHVWQTGPGTEGVPA